MVAFEPVRAIQRGLAVLRIISERGPVTVAAIARHAELPQATTVRIVETLESEGYVLREQGGTALVVSSRTIALSRGYDASSQILAVAAPHIDRLHIKIGWPSNLAIFDRDAMVMIYPNRASLGLTMPSRTGARLPLTATGVGKVALANMPPEDRKAALILAQSEGNRWDASPPDATLLAHELDRVRKRGHALASEDYLDTIYRSRIWAVAVPILDKDRNFIAGISSLVLREAGDRNQLLNRILPRLTDAAARISRSLA